MSINLTLPINSGMALSSSDQITMIRDVIAEKNSSISRKRAVQLLQAVDVPGKVQDYQNLLEDETESSDIRYLAAIGLYKTNTP
jgi:HEAT repeat protein